MACRMCVAGVALLALLFSLQGLQGLQGSPAGTVDIRDLVGTGRIQLTFHVLALDEPTVVYTKMLVVVLSKTDGDYLVATPSDFPGDLDLDRSWWQVGGFGEGPTSNAVTLFHPRTGAWLSHSGSGPVVDNGNNYPVARRWWYFYLVCGVTNTFKIGNADTTLPFPYFLSWLGIGGGGNLYTTSTGFHIEGVTQVASNSTALPEELEAAGLELGSLENHGSSMLPSDAAAAVAVASA